MALEAPNPGCAAESSGMAVGVVGGPQFGHSLAQVVHELEHGGGEAGLDEVARQAALGNKHRTFYSAARGLLSHQQCEKKVKKGACPSCPITASI